MIWHSNRDRDESSYMDCCCFACCLTKFTLGFASRKTMRNLGAKAEQGKYLENVPFWPQFLFQFHMSHGKSICIGITGESWVVQELWPSTD